MGEMCAPTSQRAEPARRAKKTRHAIAELFQKARHQLSTPKSGEKRLTLLSGEIVDLDRTTRSVMVPRDVTKLNRFELTPR